MRPIHTFRATRALIKDTHAINMADLSDHAKLRCVDRCIKSTDIDLCMRKGTRTNGDAATYKYYYKGLCVIASRGSALATQTVLTSYWIPNYVDAPQAYERVWAKTHRQKIEHLKSDKHRTAQQKRDMRDW
ncbi:MAG: hypothetical protein JZU63_02930 [Rhodoferax sp.]|nr:hypothetical protein [Rhodoferax sp.]